jgi:hypothetical protein
VHVQGDEDRGCGERRVVEVVQGEEGRRQGLRRRCCQGDEGRRQGKEKEEGGTGGDGWLPMWPGGAGQGRLQGQ